MRGKFALVNSERIPHLVALIKADWERRPFLGEGGVGTVLQRWRSICRL